MQSYPLINSANSSVTTWPYIYNITPSSISSSPLSSSSSLVHNSVSPITLDTITGSKISQVHSRYSKYGTKSLSSFHTNNRPDNKINKQQQSSKQQQTNNYNDNKNENNVKEKVENLQLWKEPIAPDSQLENVTDIIKAILDGYDIRLRPNFGGKL